MTVPHETSALFGILRALVVAENERQNLISASSVDAFETRHIADSAQLEQLLGAGATMDIGAGGGFPGLVLALLRASPIHLVEPRKRRADFLRGAVDQLGLDHAVVHGCAVERLSLPPFGNITARAVAPLTELFAMASHLADERTRWVLPKGRRVLDELEVAQRSWQGNFMLHPSATDPEAKIVVATDVRRIAR